MTPKQIDLARQALGLPNSSKRSYRNRFIAGLGHADYADWIAMASAGLAVRWPAEKLSFGGDDLFEMTRTGATLALYRGESLDPSDFPDPGPAVLIEADATHNAHAAEFPNPPAGANWDTQF